MIPGPVGALGAGCVNSRFQRAHVEALAPEASGGSPHRTSLIQGCFDHGPGMTTRSHIGYASGRLVAALQRALSLPPWRDSAIARVQPDQ